MGRILTKTPWRTRSHRTATERPQWPTALNRSSPQARGLVAWWSGQPPVGLSVTEHIHGRDGDFIQMELSDRVFINRQFGWGVNHDGTNEYVRVPHHSSFNPGTGPMSVSCWFRTSTSGAFQGLVSKRDDSVGGAVPHWFMRIQSDNTVRGQVNSSVGNEANVTGTTTVTDGNLHLALFVWAGANDVKLYIDGISEGTIGGTGTVGDIDTTDDIFMGAHLNGSGLVSSPFTGQLFDARVGLSVVNAATARQMHEPQTRWDLYSELGRVFYSVPAVVGRTTRNTDAWALGTNVGMGFRMP